MSASLRTSFLQAISESLAAYGIHGARSSKKLEPIHRWIAERTQTMLGEKYTVDSLGMNGEKTLEGKYHPKRVDIAVSRGEKTLAVASFKFVTSNYKQNSVNYFENLLGETANIRRAGIGFAHLLALRGKTPYLDKTRGNLRGEVKKIESLSEKDLVKYIKLFRDHDFPHKPQVLGIAAVNFDDAGRAYFCEGDLPLSPDTLGVLKHELSVDKFMSRFAALCQLYD